MIKRSTALALLAALAVPAAGCGKDGQKGDSIPPAVASELGKQLGSVQRRFDFGDGACADITKGNEPAVARLLDQIPSSVDSKVRDAARQSFDRLFQQTAAQCDETKGQDTTPTETSTTPAPPPETQTHTQQTDTQQTDTQQTDTQQLPPGQQKQKQPKKQKPNGNGGAKGPKGQGG